MISEREEILMQRDLIKLRKVEFEREIAIEQMMDAELEKAFNEYGEKK